VGGEQLIEIVRTFLEKVAGLILQENGADILCNMDGDSWESLVFEYSVRLNAESGGRLEIARTAPQAFPDLVINKIGVEVKKLRRMTGKRQAIQSPSLAGSLDSRRYFFLWKAGRQAKHKIRRYADCLPRVAVTHNPRYVVDMLLPDGDSIFHHMGITYEQFIALPNPLGKLTEYLRTTLKPGEEIWWLGPTANSDEESDHRELLGPILFALDERPDLRDRFRLVAMALRPEIFKSSGQDKFQNLPLLLLRRFGAVVPNMRDIFSSGGRRNNYRAIDDRLLESANEIRRIILTEPADELRYSWGVDEIFTDRISQYARLLSAHAKTSNYNLGELFLSALDAN